MTNCIPTCTTSQAVLLKNKEQDDSYIKIENSGITTGSVDTKVKNGIWQLDCVGKTFFTIKKQGTSDQFLHIKNGSLEYSKVSPDEPSAHWKKIQVPGTNDYRIENKSRPGHALHIQSGALIVGDAVMANKSAQWKMVDPGNLPPTPEDMLEVDYLGVGYDAVWVDPEKLAINSVQNGRLEPPQVFKLIPGNTSFKVMEGLGDGSNGKKATKKAVPVGVTPKVGERSFSWSNKARWALNASDYQKTFKQTYSGNVGIPDVASIKLSASFEDVQKTTQSRESAYVYKDGAYSGHILTLDYASLGPEMLTDKFKNAVKSLGTSDLAAYTAFIKNWGTHFSTDNEMGAKCSFRFTIDKTSYTNSNQTEQEFSIGVEATIEGISGGLGVDIADKQASTVKKETSAREVTFISYGGSADYKNFIDWSKAAQIYRVVIDLRLASYLELFNAHFFPNDNQIKSKYDLLSEALKQYYKANNYTETGDPRGFFTKGPRSFTVTVSRLYVKNGKKDNPLEDRLYGGILNLGVYDQLGNEIKSMLFENLNGDAWLDWGQWKYNCMKKKEKDKKVYNKSFDIILTPDKIGNTFATITGKMTYTWLSGTTAGIIPMDDKQAFDPQIGETIPLEDLAIGDDKGSKVTYTNKPDEGDILEIYFNVKRTQ